VGDQRIPEPIEQRAAVRVDQQALDRREPHVLEGDFMLDCSPVGRARRRATSVCNCITSVSWQ
jgi:hypothetical protein